MNPRMLMLCYSQALGLYNCTMDVHVRRSDQVFSAATDVDVHRTNTQTNF
jgi:hypothetical protein